MSNLENAFPELYRYAILLHDHVEPVVILLLVFAFLFRVASSMFGDDSQIFKAVLGLGVAVVVIRLLPYLFNDIQLFAFAFIEQIDASPQKLHEDFAELLLSTDKGPEESQGFWDVFRGIGTSVGEAIAYGFVYLCGQLAWAISFLLNWLQQIFMIYGLAVAPVFVGFYMHDNLRAIAGRFFLGMVSLASWPLGWAISNVFSRSLIDLSLGADGDLNSHAFWAILLLGLWVIFSSIAAPVAMHKMLTEGVSAGTSMIKGFAASMGAGALQAAAGGFTASTFGASKRWVAGAAALSGVLGFGGRASGSPSSLSSVVAGVGAGYLGSRSASRGGDYSHEAESIYQNSQK
ncbi:MAG: hypothetical protein ACPGN3_15945 [Opitutales bacterium]